MACRLGCTAIVEAEQPSTDVCSFFDRAYILAHGELVFFGSTGHDAVQLLTSAGMPCPPLYSPVEQFMRLIDPTFEVSPDMFRCALVQVPGLYTSEHVRPHIRMVAAN